MKRMYKFLFILGALACCISMSSRNCLAMECSSASATYTAKNFSQKQEEQDEQDKKYPAHPAACDPAHPVLLPGLLTEEASNTCAPTYENKVSLTLKDCLRIALEQNPQTRSAEQSIMAAQANLGVLQAQYYPDLTFYTSYTRLRLHFYLPRILNFIPQFLKTPLTVIGPQNDWNVYFQSRYNIYDGGRTRAQVRGGKAQLQAAAEDAEQVRQQIMLNVSLAFYGFLSDMHLLAVSKDHLAAAERHQGLANERKEVGDAPLSDLLRMKVSYADAKQALVKAESTIHMAAGDLNMAMGLPVDTPVKIATAPISIMNPKDIDLNIALTISAAQRPEIRASEQRLKIAYTRVEEARSAFMPQMYAEGSYGWRNSHFLPHTKNWAVGVTLEVPIFQGGGDMYRLRESEAVLFQQQAEHENLILKIRQDVWNAYFRFQQSFETINVAEAQITDGKENLRLVEERYRVGASPVRDLLDAQVALVQAEVRYAEAVWNHRASYELFLWTQGFLQLSDN